MSNKGFDARIKHKRDTASNWEAADPVILAGEVILVDVDNKDSDSSGEAGSITELRIKVGDGTSKYSELSFFDDVLREITNSQIEIVQQDLIYQNATLTATCQEMILSALESYLTTNDYEAFKTDIESRLEVLSTTVVENATNANDAIMALDIALNNNLSELHRVLNIGENATKLTGGSGSIVIEVNDNGISFSKDGVRFAFWDGNHFESGITVTDGSQAQFGNFAFVPKDDGSLILTKVS